jgi:hypothetical protein
MTRLSSGEIRGGESEPNPLGLGFAVSDVGDGGSALWYGVAGRSLIVRSTVPLVRGSVTPFFFCCRGSSWSGHHEWSDTLRWPNQPPKVYL